MQSALLWSLAVGVLPGRAGAQWKEAPSVRLAAITYYNQGEDRIELTFASPVCADDGRTVHVKRQDSTNFDAVVSTMGIALLGKFMLKVWTSTDTGSCRLLHVWLKREAV
ncbi:MAG TPA: hypothetical protein VFZ61_21790 [Polyangiales bacterium]